MSGKDDTETDLIVSRAMLLFPVTFIFSSTLYLCEREVVDVRVTSTHTHTHTHLGKEKRKKTYKNALVRTTMRGIGLPLCEILTMALSKIALFPVALSSTCA